MSTTPLPSHGTQYRYRGPRNGSWDPCRCDVCTRAQRRACTRRQLAHASGTPPMRPAQPVIQHITACSAAGMSYDLIGRRAGVAAGTIKYWARRTEGALRRETAERILAVQPGDFDDLAKRPPHGTRRRVQALYALGHSPQTIALAAGVDRATVCDLAHGRYEHTPSRTHAGVAAAYRHLITKPGGSSKARSVAARQGWHGPLAWDDIDDPDGTPETDCGPTALRITALAEDWEWLAAQGYSREHAAARLGVTKGTLDTAITRARRTQNDMETAA